MNGITLSEVVEEEEVRFGSEGVPDKELLAEYVPGAEVFILQKGKQ